MIRIFILPYPYNSQMLPWPFASRRSICLYLSFKFPFIELSKGMVGAKGSPCQGSCQRSWLRGSHSKSLHFYGNQCKYASFSLPPGLRAQIAAAIPVAALTVHRTVIHSRDTATLTLVRGRLGCVQTCNRPINCNLAFKFRFIDQFFTTVV